MYSFSHHSPTPDEFAELVAESLINRGSSDGQLIFDRQGFSLLINDSLGRPNKHISLSSFYREYCSGDVQTREKVLLQASGVGSNRAWQIESRESSLVPEIVDRWSVEKMRLESQNGAPAEASPQAGKVSFDVLGHVLAEHFAVLLALDLPESKVYVTSAHLEDSRQSFDQALNTSIRNVRTNRIGRFESLEHADTQEIILHSTNWRDQSGVAQVLLAKEIEALSVSGDHLIFINRNNMFVTGTESERGLMYAYSEMRTAQNEPNPLPPFAILLKNGEYSHFQVSSKSLWHHFFRQMELRYLSNVYRWQKELLQRRYPNLISGCHLVDYELAKNDAGRMFSYCAAEERSGPVLIPQTDFVYFQNRNGRAASGSLARIRFMFPDLLEATQFYPSRFVMNHFPTAPQLAAIGLTEMFE